MRDGRLLQVNVSPGGVPKLPVERARITRAGVEGDRQREVTVHGGPHRAVSILGIEAIRRVAAEGHPIAPGTTGENLTTEGFDVSSLPLGTRLAIGSDVVVELSGVANPCRTIRDSFVDLRFGRLGAAAHPADSRMYARVVREGTVRPGDRIRVEPPVDDRAERFSLAERLDASERASALAVWRAARDAGHEVVILDDGELAAAAAPSLPGPIFNHALGFAHLPNLVQRGVGFFRGAGVTGWIWAEDEPWPGAPADGTAIHAAVDTATLPGPGEAGDGGVAVRELGRDEIGVWAAIVGSAAGLARPVARAFADLEGHLARAAHHHRFVAERNGTPVGVGSLHTHRGAGWLRAGAVLPEARGRGVHRALIRARIERARRLGCDVVGASATEGGASASNLARMGARVVAVRRRYRVETSDSRA